MRVRSLIDEKKKAAFRNAMEKGDASVLRSKKNNNATEPPARQSDDAERLRVSNQLLNAVFMGDLDAVSDAIRSGADPNTKTDDGFPILTAAVTGFTQSIEKKLAIIDLLLSNGARINEKGGELERTALIVACEILGTVDESADKPIIDLLISRGADIEIKDQCGSNALIRAAGACRSEFVKLLISRGADVDARDLGGRTALIFAVNFLDIVQILFSARADINASDNAGQSALMKAVWSPETVKFLLSKGAAANAKDNSGDTALTLAAKEGKLETVKLLFSSGAKTREKNNEGLTAYEIAVREGHNEVAKFLRFYPK